MSKRVYQIVAVATLVGAPIVVQVLSAAVPGAQQAVEAARHDDRAVEPSPPSDPVTPPPSAPPAQMAQGVAEPLFDAKPSMDAQGIAPAASLAGSEGEAPPPPPPPPPSPMRTAKHADDIIGPPPPRTPEWMEQ